MSNFEIPTSSSLDYHLKFILALTSTPNTFHELNSTPSPPPPPSRPPSHPPPHLPHYFIWKVSPTESLVVWSDVNDAINSGNWSVAKEAKTRIEQEEREKRKTGKATNELWEPVYFSKDAEGGGWKWKGGETGVGKAPARVPAPRPL